MRATRRSQPYRKNQQVPGPALDAMLKGKPRYLNNPADRIRAQRSALAELARRWRR